MQENSSWTPVLPEVAPRWNKVKVLASTALRSGLLIAGLATTGITAAKADTINKYNFVADYLQAGSTGSLDGSVFGVKAYDDNTASSTTSITFTAWNSSGAPSATSLYFGTKNLTTGALNTSPLGTTSTSESEITGSAIGSLTPRLVGIYAGKNPSTNNSSNVYINLRNFRIKYGGVATLAPIEVSYANIANGGTYSSLPSAADVNNPTITGVGFTGYAKPDPSGAVISDVYVSLQQPNGLFWDNSTSSWTHLRKTYSAARKVVDFSTQRIQWSIINVWPTGSIPSGVYKLRAMARTGSGSGGPGTENLISFTIGTTPTPTPTAPPADTTSPNPSQLTTPTVGSTATAITTLAGTCSDNAGGSGVNRVAIQLIRVNSAGVYSSWNFTTGEWGVDDGGTGKIKDATLNGSKTGWSITSGLPPATLLPNGNYRVNMTTYDLAGNPYTWNSQAFSLDKAVSYFRIRNRAQATSYIYDAGANASYGTSPASTNKLYQWEITRYDPDYIRIVNRSTGDVLNVENDGANAEATPGLDVWQSSQWRLEISDSGYVRFANMWKFTKYIHIENLTGNVQSGTILPAWQSAQWYLEPVTADTTAPNTSTLTAPTPNSTVSVVNYLTGACSDNVGGSGIKLVNVQYVKLGTTNQSWSWTTGTWGADDGAADKMKAAKLNAAGTMWTINNYLPPLSALTNGNYRIVLTTYDFANNPFSWTAPQFTLNKGSGFISPAKGTNPSINKF